MTVADLVAAGGLVASRVTLDGVPLALRQDVPGAVNIDASAAFRRSIMLNLAHPEPLDRLIGGELRAYRGMVVDGQVVEELLGVFQVSDDNLTDSSSGMATTVTGHDAARSIALNRFVEPWIIAPATNLAIGLKAVILDRRPGTVFNFAVTAAELPTVVWGVQREHDPWALSQDAAAADGMELFFDRHQVCVLRPVPDPAKDPFRWELREGEGGTLVSIAKARTDAKTYTRVIVTGEAADATPPVQATAIDTALETELGLPRPYFLTSSYVTTTDQALQAAEAQLRKVNANQEHFTFSALVNPAMDAHDIVRFTRERAGLYSTLAVVERLTIPLGLELMSGTTRERRVT